MSAAVTFSFTGRNDTRLVAAVDGVISRVSGTVLVVPFDFNTVTLQPEALTINGVEYHFGSRRAVAMLDGSWELELSRQGYQALRTRSYDHATGSAAHKWEALLKVLCLELARTPEIPQIMIAAAEHDNAEAVRSIEEQLQRNLEQYEQLKKKINVLDNREISYNQLRERGGLTLEQYRTALQLQSNDVDPADAALLSTTLTKG